MYIYTVKAIKDQKGKSEDAASIKYQVKRVNNSIPSSKKGHSEIIRDNLDYEEAVRLSEGFNDMEAKSQDKRERDETVRQKEPGS